MGKDNNKYFNGFWMYHDRVMTSIEIALNELENSYTRGQKGSLNDYVNSCMKPDNERAYKKVIAEISYFGGLGDYALYSFILEVFNDDEQAAKDFMLSPQGGFTKTEISNIKSRYQFQMRKLEAAAANEVMRC